MRQQTINIYKFEELTEKAKAKAIDNFRDINVDTDWYDLALEEYAGELTELGFINPKVMFSGFVSQGDGACFTCEQIDFNVFLNGKYKSLDISADITHNYRYYFATSTTVNLNSGDDISEELNEEIQQSIEDERERLGNDIYKRLEVEYFWRMEDAQVIESIISNEYEFTADGEEFY